MRLVYEEYILLFKITKYKISIGGIYTPVKRDSYIKDGYIPLFKTTNYKIRIGGIYISVKRDIYV